MTGLASALGKIHAPESDPPDPGDEDNDALVCGPSSGSTVPSEAPKDMEEVQGFRLASTSGAALAHSLPRVSSSVLSSSSLRERDVSFHHAWICMNYCMTMSCIEHYGSGTTSDSIFHSKDIPPIKIWTYMRRFLVHLCSSSSAFLAGLLLIFRFSFSSFPIDIYCVHRLILTGASVGVKVQDDATYSITYFSSLGGVKPDELVELQKKMCNALKWNLYFHPEDYRELLDVMDLLMEPPTAEDLWKFKETHGEMLAAFDMNRLSVTEQAKWFWSDYDKGETSPREDPIVARVKAVFALDRWERIMKPWLRHLHRRCADRENTIDTIMISDAQECAKRSSPVSPPYSSSPKTEKVAFPRAFSHHDPSRLAPNHADVYQPRKVHQPPFVSVCARSEAAPPPSMGELIYATPYVKRTGRAATAQSNAGGWERPLIGHKRAKPSTFKD